MDNLSFHTLRDFYVRFKLRFHLDKWERIMAHRLFVDERGKPRLFEPDFTDRELMELADMFCQAERSLLLPERLFATLKRSLQNVRQELSERIALRQQEEELGLRATNSLAISKLDLGLVKILTTAGYRSRMELQNAADDSIIKIDEIGNARLRHIRSVCPHRATKTMQRRLAAQLQQSLF